MKREECAMEQERFLAVVDASIKLVYSKDSKLFEVEVGERAIAHRLAIYLEESCVFDDYSVDCEYNRYGVEGMVKRLPGIERCRRTNEPKDWITPDIVIHRRQSEERDNLAVFEIKSFGSLDACDKLKLKGMTKRTGAFRYDFGIGIEFRREYYNWFLVVNGVKRKGLGRVDIEQGERSSITRV